MIDMRLFAGVAALMVAQPALAQSDAGDSDLRITAGVTGGTLGIGPEVGVRFNDTVGIRGNATFLNFGADFDSNDIAYDGKLKLKSFGAMVDVYPFANGFRISGGARVNRNRANVVATPTGTVEVGDTTYTAAQVGTLMGRADVKKFAPALTLGWASQRRQGFMFGIDAGVLFQGKARLREFTATGLLASNPSFQASIERERLDLQDDIDKVSVYPIVQATVGWSF